MKIDLFKDKYLDILFINNRSLAYFKITQEKAKIKVLKSEKIEAAIYSQGAFRLSNLESAVQTLLKKHKLTELGIVLNIPNVIFQRINLPRGTSAKEAIINYLKTNFPLAIEKYALFYKEDKYRSLPTLATFNIFLISKEIIDLILSITERYGLTPLFITPTAEIFYQYLVNKTILDFNEDYLVFVLTENNLVSFLIKNLRLEKIILEEYLPERIDLELALNRIYDFLRPELKPTTRILLFLEQQIELTNIEQQKFFFPITINALLEGAYFAFTNILADRQIVDFVPLKNYTIYFLNRLPAALTFLSLYVLPLIFLASISFFILQNKFNKEITTLSAQIKTVPSIQNQTDLENLIKITSLIKPDIIDRFLVVNKIKKFPLDKIEFNHQEVIFSLKFDQKEQEKIKFEISQELPKAKLIEETSEADMVKLKYSF